jgi:hypothetical protein
MNEIKRIVDMIEADENNIGILSCSEQIAAALLYNRLEWLSAVKVRQNLGQVVNKIALRYDEYIVERAGKPLVAIIPVEKYLSMKRERDEFFRMYDAMQAEVAAEDAANIDRDIEEALVAARR